MNSLNFQSIGQFTAEDKRTRMIVSPFFVLSRTFGRERQLLLENILVYVSSGFVLIFG